LRNDPDVNPGDWQPIRHGETIGLAGSENGTIIVDEEHPFGARITLERETRWAPFAITCGVYGWMVHTRFFKTPGEADDAMREMKVDLKALASNPSGDGASDFIDRYP
jgi:hypothetical protein